MPRDSSKKNNENIWKDRNVDSLREYISDKPALTYEEQLWIFRKDPSRRTESDSLKLIDSNLAMVFRITSVLYKRHKYMSNNFTASCEVPFSDMFQAGVLGLNRAIQKFDSTLKMKFSTYSYFWIEVFVKNEIKRNVSPMKTQNYAKVSFCYTDSDSYRETSIPGNIYGALEYYDILDVAKKHLDELDYKIFTMRFVDELDIKDIALDVNRCAVTVRTHIKKIQNILGKKLRSHHG